MTRVLLAVMAGDKTSTAVSERTGLSRVWVYRIFHRLRDLGLIDFADHRKGTLRPRVHVVPVTTEVLR